MRRLVSKISKKTQQRISKNSVHKPCRVSTFAAVLKGIFFTYCFLRLNTICVAVCHVILMQYLSYISYTFHHLVGEITKDIATHCKTLFIKALRSFNYFCGGFERDFLYLLFFAS